MLVLEKIRIPTFFLSVLLIGISIITLDTRADTRAQQAIEAKMSGCPELPDVAWWRTTRIKIVNYVDLKYRGNWVPYIQKWETYRQKMQGILASNGTALVKSRNIRLHGDKLASHIQEIEQRLDVTKCLKRKFSGQLAYNKISTSMSLEEPLNNYNIYLSSNRIIQISEDLNPAIIDIIDINKASECDEVDLSETEKMFAEMCL
jgi:hypothetical protein